MSVSLIKWWNSNFHYILFFLFIIIVVLAIILYIYKDDIIKNKTFMEWLFFDPKQHVKLKSYKKKKSIVGTATDVNVNESQQNDNSKSFVKESKGEIISKKVAEELFDKKFSKVRPEILKNDVTKHNLELDIYNDELKLAIEYSGRQHYEYVPFFHKNYEAFLNQRYRDEMKKNKCKESGIKLIEVPYKVKHEDIPQFIRTKAIELGFFKEKDISSSK